MKTELALFSIDGSVGGSQEKMVNPWMNLGGCAALAAVDTCLALTLHGGFSGLCPIDAGALSWESYNQFAESMRPYLSPRMMGVNRLSYYTDGFGAYLRDIGCRDLSMKALSMGVPAETAGGCIKEQIDGGFPVPMLHLNAKTPAVREYQWHWFLLTGYTEEDGEFSVKAVTYGEEEWLRLTDLWNETDPENGGLILYRRACPDGIYPLEKRAAAIIGDRERCPEKILAVCAGTKPDYSFPSVQPKEGEAPEAALTDALEKLGFPITVVGLLAIHEYDEPPYHISERCYKAVPQTAGQPLPQLKDGKYLWMKEEEMEAAPWRPCDEPLIHIIRSDMTDTEVIRRRIAAEEAEKEKKK